MLIFMVGVLLAVIAILLMARPKKAEGKAAEETTPPPSDYSRYMDQALLFISFYETLPQKTLFVITPVAVGVAIANHQLGAAVGAYLKEAAQRPAQKEQLAEALVRSQAELLGGDKGTRLFHQLGLSVSLHNDDEDWPFLYLPLAEADPIKRDRYAKDIQKIYQQMYEKRLEIHLLSAY